MLAELKFTRTAIGSTLHPDRNALLDKRNWPFMQGLHLLLRKLPSRPRVWRKNRLQTQTLSKPKFVLPVYKEKFRTLRSPALAIVAAP